LYESAYSITRKLRQNYAYDVVDVSIISDVEPVSSTYYELNGVYSLYHIGMASVSLFYKDLQSIPVFASQLTDNTSVFQYYSVIKQIGSLIARGIELEFISNRIFGFKVHGAFSFQKENKFEKYIGFKSNLLFDYRTGNDENILLDRFGISLQTIFNDGRLALSRNNFTGELEVEARARQPLANQDELFLPSFLQFNFKVDKTFSISNLLDVNLYAEVINIFDAKNILEVFIRTGNDYDDGIITNPELIQQFINTYGEIYPDLYSAIRLNYKEQTLGSYNQQYGTEVFYGPPRQIRFGIRLEY
jgi:hypothetical protein